MTGRRLSFLLAAMLMWTANANAVPVVIKLQPAARLSTITSLLGGTLLDSLPGVNTYLLQLPVLPVLTPVLRLLGVEWLELDRRVSLPYPSLLGLLETPNYPLPDWYRHQPSFKLINAAEALQHSTGRGLLVADINSRVDYGHPALLGHLTAGADFVTTAQNASAKQNDQSTTGFLDDEQSTTGFLDGRGTALDQQRTATFLNGSNFILRALKKDDLTSPGGAQDHGTFCAGLIAAVAPNATIMPLRAFDDNGNSDAFTIAKALYYAKQQGAHVINMSFGLSTDTRVIREAVASASAAHIVLVASAGNNNTNTPQYPAAYAGVITAAATDLSDRKTSFSNYGSTIFVDAPGSLIVSSISNGRYSVASGTSYSAAIVSGMAALIRSLRYGGVSLTISQSVVGIDDKNPRYAGQLGYGRIDMLKAVRRKD